MNCAEANQIDIVDYLSFIGHLPQKKYVEMITGICLHSVVKNMLHLKLNEIKMFGMITGLEKVEA